MKRIPAHRDIAARMTSLGWSQTRLARESDVPRVSINRYLNGKAELSPASMRKVVDAMGGVSGVAWGRKK